MTDEDRPPLDPDAAALLERLQVAGAPPLQEATPAQARAAHVAGAAAASLPSREVAEVEDREVAGVRVRVYRPQGARGTTVYVHGGGWVVGTLDTYDSLCRTLAAEACTTVVSVDYDLAPEARHPVAVQQVLAVLREAAQDLPAPLAVAGDSAGAHLALLAAGLAVREGVALAAQALVYPVVSPALDTPSARENATGYYLETEGMRWYWRHYLTAGDGGSEGGVPADASAQELRGLPPALVLTAGYDPLRDEGLALADALEAAGVEVERLSYDGQVHGFVRLGGVVAQGREAAGRVAAFLARRLTA